MTADLLYGAAIGAVSVLAVVTAVFVWRAVRAGQQAIDQHVTAELGPSPHRVAEGDLDRLIEMLGYDAWTSQNERRDQ
jgi:hypothetical protein